MNLNNVDEPTSEILAFAQTDMIDLFLEGISQNERIFIIKTLLLVFKNMFEIQDNDVDVIIERFYDEYNKYRNNNRQSIINVISTLPKEEMAAMAEALVEITSLRRKVDSPLETVGGPTDVAVISKGDGLIWIKRKHYFDINLNQEFLLRKELNYGVKNGDRN